MKALTPWYLILLTIGRATNDCDIFHSCFPFFQAPPPQVQQTAAITVVTTQPVVVQAAVFKDFPVTITDSKGQQVQTVLEYRNGILTWIVAGVICLLTIEFGLCCFALIPFCINGLKDVYHINPTDGNVVGVYRRLDWNICDWINIIDVWRPTTHLGYRYQMQCFIVAEEVSSTTRCWGCAIPVISAYLVPVV